MSYEIHSFKFYFQGYCREIVGPVPTAGLLLLTSHQEQKCGMESVMFLPHCFSSHFFLGYSVPLYRSSLNCFFYLVLFERFPLRAL